MSREREEESKRRRDRESSKSNRKDSSKERARDRRDKEAKDRARRSRKGSSSTRSPSRSDRYSEQDRNAKARGRRKEGSDAPLPGAVTIGVATDDQDSKSLSSRGSRESRRRDKERQSRQSRNRSNDSDTRERRRRDKERESRRRDKEKESRSSGARGARASNRPPRTKSDGLSQSIHSVDLEDEVDVAEVPDVEAVGKEEEVAVTAMAVDEMAEVNDRLRATEARNRMLEERLQELSQQQQVQGTSNVNESNSNGGKKKWAMIISLFLLLAGGGVAAYFLTRPTEDPVKDIETTSAPVSIAPIEATTNAPTPAVVETTSVPTILQLFSPPSSEDCSAIQNGQPVENQDTLIPTTFDMGMELEFAFDVDFENDYLPDMVDSTQTFLGQELTQCFTTTRRLELDDSKKYVIGNVIVNADGSTIASCNNGTNGAHCYSITFTVEIFLKEMIEKHILELTTLILNAFGEDGIVQTLQLPSPPFQQVAIKSLSSLEPTDAPTKAPTMPPTTTMHPSRGPTASPSMVVSMSPTFLLPTTGEPTRVPSSAPTTGLPTKSPTDAPSKTPTVSPTPAPTRMPVTGVPTKAPSKTPTSMPSALPSTRPTITPSAVPSMAPTSTPSTVPSMVPTTLIHPITFPEGSTYTKTGIGISTACNTRYWLGCPDVNPDCVDSLDPHPRTTITYAYTNETVARPVFDFNITNNPVWEMDASFSGSDCANPSTACGQDSMRGGFQIDLSGTDFVFHADTAIWHWGWASYMTIVVDRVQVIDGSNLSAAAGWTLGSSGGKKMTAYGGGWCGGVNSAIKLTLES